MAAKKKPAPDPANALDLFAAPRPPVAAPPPALPVPPPPRPVAPAPASRSLPAPTAPPPEPSPPTTGSVHCACRGTREVQALPEDVADRWPRRSIVLFSSWRIARTGVEGVPVPWEPGGCYVDVWITDARLLPPTVERETLPCPSCCDPAPAIRRTLVLALHGRIVSGPVGVGSDG